MAFLETPRFPECVSFGALSKPRYKTNTVPLASGYKSRNIEWAQGLHSFDFSHNALLPAAHTELLNFFHALQGAGHQFRVKDFGDYQTSATTGILIPLHGSSADTPVGSVGLGYGARTYLAGKKYVSGALTTVRWLQKLVSGSVTVSRGGSPLTVGASPGQIAIDTATGKIAFVADQSRAISSQTVGASHVMTFTSAFSPNFTVGQRIFIDGVTGTAATALNNKSHAITVVSSATITIATSTAGLTAANGSGYFYPQAAEALTVVCEFDVPCVFSSDEASWEILDKSRGDFVYRWSGINIEEDRIAL